MTAYTVTVSSTAANSEGLLFRVKALTGATEAGGTSYAQQYSNAAGENTSFTPAGTNSYIEFATEYGNEGAFTQASNNTLDDNVDDSTVGGQLATGYYSGTVTSGTPVTVGTSAPTTQSPTLAVYEVLASGGSTPALDGSSPAVVHNDSNPATGTTASFSPPAGSVLVVAIACSDNTGSEPLPLAVSSTPALTWTQRAIAVPSANVTFYSQSAVFTATVPAGTTVQQGWPGPQVAVGPSRQPFDPLARKFGPAQPFSHLPSAPPPPVPANITGTAAQVTVAGGAGTAAGQSVPYIVQTATSAAATESSVAFTLGAAPSAGNTLVAFCSYSQLNTTRTMPVPSGWVKLSSGMGTYSAYLAVFLRVVQSGDGTSWPFSILTGSGNDAAAGVMYEIAGADTIQAAGRTSMAGFSSQSSPATPAVPPSTTGCLALAGVSVSAGLTLSSVTSGWTSVAAGGSSQRLWTASQNTLTTDTVTSAACTFSLSGSTSGTTQILLIQAAQPARTFLTGKTGTGTAARFTDGNGDPFMVRCDTVWNLMQSAGETNDAVQTVTYDITTYLATRAAQGYNAVVSGAIGDGGTDSGYSGGLTWDGIAPFVSGNPGSLNSAYWARMDQVMTTAQSYGITVLFYAVSWYALTDTGGALNGKTATDLQNYGAALGARYASAPNLVWMLSADYVPGSHDALLTAFMTGLRGAGDTHLMSTENQSQENTRDYPYGGTTLTWGYANADYESCYNYGAVYPNITYAWGVTPQVPVLQADGMYYDPSAGITVALRDYFRQLHWWALTCASRGSIIGFAGLWNWGTNVAGTYLSDHQTETDLNVIWSLVANLSGWHLLVPDTGSVLVTAGRGTQLTPIANGATSYKGGNDYVTAAITPDRSLAVIYIPDAANTITIDQAQVGTGYTATWVDPVTGTQTPATTGSTYTNSGTNAAGGTDWALILQGPPVANITGAGAQITVAGGAGTPSGGAGVTGTGAQVAVIGGAGSPSGGANVTGVAAQVTVAGGAGTPSGGAATAGTAAGVSVAGGPGVPSGGAGVTGAGAQVTVAGGTGTPASGSGISGTAAQVTVAAGLGTPSGGAGVTGAGAQVVVAGGAGAPASGASLTGTGAQVTVAGGAGTPSGGAGVTGVAAQVTVAGGAGTVSAGVNVSGAGAQVTVAGVAGTPAAGGSVNVAGAGALVSAAGGAGTSSGGAGVTGAGAQVAVTGGAGALSAGVAVTGIAATVTVAGGAGVPSAGGSVNITGAAAQVAVAGGAGTPSGGAGVTGVAATVLVQAGAGQLAASANIAGSAALIAVLGGAGVPASSAVVLLPVTVAVTPASPVTVTVTPASPLAVSVTPGSPRKAVITRIA